MSDSAEQYEDLTARTGAWTHRVAQTEAAKIGFSFALVALGAMAMAKILNRGR